MSRTMFLLSLIACLAGTPLRQAEAAHDLARSIDEIDRGALVEEVDGGVGDDSNVALKGCVLDASTSDLGPTDGWPLATSTEFLIPRPIDVQASETGFPAFERTGRRLAWLQRFRC